MSDDEAPSSPYYDSHYVMKDVYDKTFWCIYTCCEGFGVSGCGDPCLISQLKCCCCEQSLSTTDCCGEEGCVFGVSKICCLVSMAGFPPGSKGDQGIPACACCNCRCGGGDGDDDEEEETQNKMIAKGTFLCFFCCCEGFGLMCGGDAPKVYGDSKLCCLRSHMQTAECNDPDTGCCYDHSKCCCLVTAQNCPPGGGKHDGIPLCACCGVKCGGEEPEEEDEGEGAPEQQSMMG